MINRYGFNSKGLEYVGDRLERYVGSRAKRQGNGHRAGVLGVNLGKNKLTEDAASDYVRGVHALGKYADYLVVNVSSPNTPGLRTLQGKIQLQNLLVRVLKARDEVAAKEERRIPLLVKIAPDLTEDDKQDIADVALELKLDGLVVSNTTLSRPDTLKGEAKGETGGLSGLPCGTCPPRCWATCTSSPRARSRSSAWAASPRARTRTTRSVPAPRSCRCTRA